MTTTRSVLALAACLAAAACSSSNGGTNQADAGPTDTACPQSAPCSLASAAPAQGYICVHSGTQCLGGDQDWYAIDVATSDPRQLLSVRATYPNQTSPVVLAINILKSNGTTSLGTAVDPGGTNPGAQTVVRLPDAGRYFIVVSNDPAGDPQAVERRFPYTLTATVSLDPDANEPNDTTPTDLGALACGTATVNNKGALATPGDIDRFKFTVPDCGSGSARTLLYVQVADTVPDAVRSAPNPPRLNVQATLTPPTGAARSDIGVWIPTAPEKPAMAVLVPAGGGTYQLAVQNYKQPNSSATPIGDPRFTYTVTVKAFADLDPSEGSQGNDTLATATVVPLGVGSTVTKQGRLSFIDDVDTYKVTGQAGAPTRVHYKLTYAADAGQFEPLPHDSVKVLEAVEDMGNSTVCKNTCPGGSGTDYGADWCTRNLCLWQRRLQDAEKLPNYENFEGELWLPPGGAKYIQVKYQLSPAADDKTYSLELSGAAGQDLHNTLATANSVNAGSPIASTLIGWGFGQRTRDRAPSNRGPLPTNTLPDDPVTHDPGTRVDYDAASQVDFYKVAFPAGGDKSLGIGWALSGGMNRSYDVGMRFYFCSDAGCTNPKKSQFLGYASGTDYPWYSSLAAPVGPFQVFTFDQAAGKFDMNPQMCVCIDSAYTGAGFFYVEVQAQDRTSYQDTTATLNLPVGAYPPSGSSCPSPCAFVSKAL